jgi:hypothetical protein
MLDVKYPAPREATASSTGKNQLCHVRVSRRISLGLLATAAMLVAAACSKNIQNEAAVKQAVLDYLNARASQTGLNMASMNLQVTALTFEQDQARATIYFQPKNMQGGGMSMSYTLDRKGDKWVVRGRQETGANPHGAGGFPAGQAPGGTITPGQPLPPGHPGIGGNSGTPGGTNLPPNHPPIGSQQ